MKGLVKYLGTTLMNQNSNQEEIKGTLNSECLISFGAESFVFLFGLKKFKDLDIQNYNFACCFLWV
jgi:hypothetical protein